MSTTVGEGKKRKRTGRQREEAKARALQEAKEPATSSLEADGEASPVAAPLASARAKPSPDQRIPTALKALHPIFKQAKRQEVQRLVKKLKFLKTKSDGQKESGDLAAQMQLLSHIALDPIIASHLRLKLSKHSAYKQSTLPQPIIELLTPDSAMSSASTSAAPGLLAKVENRLCSAKIVAKAVKNTTAWIMGEDGARLVKRGEKKSASARNGEKGDRREKTPRGPKGADVAEEDEEGESGSNDDDDESTSNLDRVVLEQDSEDEAADAAGWESGSISGSDGYGEGAGGAPLGLGDSDEDDDGSDGGGNEEGTTVDIPARPSKAPRRQAASPPAPSKPAKRKHEAVTSSTFLPSLSAGFTLGDDDSDPDMDFDADGVIGSKHAVKKNRRGQRARQAIWEKKYGKNAKHVKKIRDEEREEARKKAEQRAQREEKLALRNKLTGGRPDRGWGGRPPTNVAPSAPAFAPSPRPAASESDPATKHNLHPSWQAARMRRLKEGGGVAGEAPKATKIVFD